MGDDSGNWEEDGSEDSLSFEPGIEYDPLALLACDLAICIMYLEQSNGGWCDECTCALKWHCSTDFMGCELCGCNWLHIRPLPPIISAARIPIKATKGANLPDGGRFPIISFERGSFGEKERSTAARNALRELTE